MTTTKLLTIFEGCDGAGKTTAAKAFAALTGACYVHCGPAIGVTTDHARLYLEAMLPALLGYQDVVMDRSWISEPIYGHVYRGGATRIRDRSYINLTDSAVHCRLVAVRCDPGWDTIRRNLESRGEAAVPEELEKVRQVYDLYKPSTSFLGYEYIDFDYTKSRALVEADIRTHRPLTTCEAYTLTELIKMAI
jgi:thymidylate kinase